MGCISSGDIWSTTHPSQISILWYFVVFRKPFKNWFSLPIRQIELEMHEEAKALFE
jgi:hypothetical protein